MIGNAFEGNRLFGKRITTSYLYRALLQVARAEGKAYRDTLEFVLGKLPSGFLVVVIVQLNAYASSA